MCIGLAELINNTPRQLLTEYISELIPAVRHAICDNSGSVRNAASSVISLLFQSVGANATTPIISWLITELKKDKLNCLDGLGQLLIKQPNMVLPIIMDKLVSEGFEKEGGPGAKAVTSGQIHGLATLAMLEDTGTFYRHLAEVLEPMIKTLAQPELKEKYLIK